MSPKDVINYIEKKVISIPEFNHRPDQRKESFFVIDDPYDLYEFDEALRNSASFPAVLCELSPGVFEDVGSSSNFLNSITITFMVLDAQDRNEKRVDVKSRCFKLGTELLKSIHKDHALDICPGQRVTIEMNSNYQPVGPLASNYWGYQFDLTFIVSMTWC